MRSLVGTLSIVCLLLGAVNAQSNSLTQQHSNSGSYGITATTQAQDQQHHVDLARELFISIPPLNAAEALNRFAKQTGIQMLYSYEQVFTRKARPVVGQYAVMDALTLLLEGSGLEVSLSSKGAITISDSEKVAQHNQRERINMNSKMNTKKTLLASMVGLFAAAGGASSAMAQGDEAATAQGRIDEIIVTANKREQSLQDTAMSISALTGDTIEKRGLVGMDDYLRNLPGVNMQDLGAGQNSVVIRGIASDPQLESGNVGVYFGETPINGLGTPSNTGGAGNADIKLVDIERIEVLRGPQGTLYGSGSMGGTVRIIPNSPNLEQVEGKLGTRLSQTDKNGGSNSMAQAIINLPLIQDKLAVRAVGYRFDNSGFIKNVAASQPTPSINSATSQGGIAADRDDVGNDTYTGFRISTLWQASPDLDVTLTYNQQKIEQDGYPEVDLDLANAYEQVRLKTGKQGSLNESLANDINITNLVINYDLGWGAISSSSSWVDYEASLNADLSHHAGFGNSPIYAGNDLDWTIFFEELRLASKLDGRLQFLTGIYFEERERDFLGPWNWSGDPNLDSGELLAFSAEDKLEQAALFGELSYEINDQLKVTLGARHFDYETEQTSTFEFGGNIVFADQFVDSNEKGQTYKLNLAYKPTEDTLVYGEWSEGFRMGKGLLQNPQCIALGVNSPAQLDADTSENYEVGIKSSLIENRITINATAYRINWDGMPISVPLPQCNSAAFFNAGTSKAEGVELELKTQILDNLDIDFSASYGEAVFTEDTSLGNKGDNLPGSADFNVSIGMEYAFAIAAHDGFVRFDYSYIGEYFNNVAEIGQAAGGYEQVNIKAGLALEQINLDLFVNNITNSTGLSWVESVNTVLGTTRGFRIRPRTIGLNIAYTF